MEVLSDISSVTTFNSMPPLVDRFGRVVFDDRTTETMEEGVDATELPLNTHLYFDDEGNECSYEEYLYRLADEYTRFFHQYDAAPVLIVNSENLNFVDSTADFDLLFARISAMRGPREFFSAAT